MSDLLIERDSGSGHSPGSSATADAGGNSRAVPAGGRVSSAPASLETTHGAFRAPIVDVWSRTQPRYRRRAVLLLLVNLVLFCGLCVFTHWLHFARMFDFSWTSYAEPLRFWGPQTQTLNDFVREPINVVQTPMHGIVLGLLVASMVAVPISVSILYRFPAATPFAAAVFIFAHMPWLGVTLILACILASVRPFRMKFRFGSALVGLLPVLLYLFLATRGAADAPEAFASPEEKQLLTMPWVLAILAASGMLSAILGLAKLVNYRPGVVPPVIAVMFATPAVLFYQHVGADELSYRVIEREYSPHSLRFEPVQDARPLIVDLLHRWTQSEAILDPGHETVLALWRGNEDARRQLKQRIVSRMTLDLLYERREAFEACKSFIADYPESRYVVNALYLMGRALDTRLDEGSLLGEAPLRELYADFPHIQSLSTWDTLCTEFPDSPLAAAAALRSAQLHLRTGSVDKAAGRLREVLARHTAATQPAGVSRGALPDAALAFDPRPYLRDAQALLELIELNRDDPQYGHEPLVALAGLDARRPRYERALRDLIAQYRGSLLEDNLIVLWALEHEEPTRRAELLETCALRSRGGDAEGQALLRLAELELRVLSRHDEAARERGVVRLRDVAERFQGSAAGQTAAELLVRLAVAPTSSNGKVSP